MVKRKVSYDGGQQQNTTTPLRFSSYTFWDTVCSYHSDLKLRVRILIDGTLIIYRVKPEDAGKYTCSPSNSLGISPSASAYLTVQCECGLPHALPTSSNPEPSHCTLHLHCMFYVLCVLCCMVRVGNWCMLCTRAVAVWFDADPVLWSVLVSGSLWSTQALVLMLYLAK